MQLKNWLKVLDLKNLKLKLILNYFKNAKNAFFFNNKNKFIFYVKFYLFINFFFFFMILWSTIFS